MRMQFREAFDPTRAFIIARDIRLDGEALLQGEVFPKTRVKLVRLRQLFDQRALRYRDETGKMAARRPNPRRPILRDEYAPEETTEFVPARPARIRKPRLTAEQLRGHVAVPDDWEDFSWIRVRAIAVRMGARTDIRKTDAYDLIKLELARRARVKADGGS